MTPEDAEKLAKSIDMPKHMRDTIDCRRSLAKPVAEINRLREIEEAAINMCKVKGRYHSEIAMRRLMEVCGFETPND